MSRKITSGKRSKKIELEIPSLDELSRKPSDEELAVLTVARYIDGHGSLGLYSTEYGIKKHVWVIHTDINQLKEMQAILGGHIKQVDKANRWSLNWQSNTDVHKVLKYIVNEMIVYKARAEAIIVYLEAESDEEAAKALRAYEAL